MSSNLSQHVIAVAYTPETFPAGTGPVDSISAVLTGAAVGNTTPTTLSIPLGATSVTASLAADTYTYTLDNFDASNNPIGGPFTGTLVFAAPATVTLSLASGLTVTS
jgi:hypothetical protein